MSYYRGGLKHGGLVPLLIEPATFLNANRRFTLPSAVFSFLEPLLTSEWTRLRVKFQKGAYNPIFGVAQGHLHANGDLS